jgi:predicted dehydrogenase/nucleoside-diphosphate-sugar epimerase
MKVAIVGAGQIARIHAPLIRSWEGAELVAVVDADARRAKQLASECGVEAWYDDLQEMLDRHRPDVVHVTVPPAYHADVAITAMEAGCHVLVEKPIATNLAEAKRMLAAAQSNGVQLCPNHNFVYEDLVQKAVQLVRSGAIGKPISVEASFLYDVNRNPALSEDGAEYAHWAFGLDGGPLQDLLPHPASLLAEFIERIDDVHVIEQSRNRLPEGFNDELRVAVKSEDVTGLIEVSFSARPDTVSLCVKGTEGTLNADLFANVLILDRKSSLPRAIARGLSALGIGFQFLRGSAVNVYQVATGKIDKSGGIGRVIPAFYDALSKGSELPFSPEKALLVVDLIDRVWPEPSAGTRRIAETRERARASGPKIEPTVLVTGAAGFIGSHLLARLLNDGVAVRAMVRPGSPRAGRIRRLDVEFFEGDLTDPQALREATKGIEVVYHLGCAMTNDPEDHRVATIEASQTLLDAALSDGVRRFIYVSTLALCDVASLPDGASVSEDIGYSPELGAYAEAKMKVEGLVRDACKRGLAATVFRPGIVIGPRGRVLFPHMGYGYNDQLFLIIGKGDVPLPITYVENTVDAFCRAASAEAAPGQTYQIVDEGNVTGEQFIEQFVRDAGLQSRIVHVPFPAAYLAAAAYEAGAAMRLLPAGLTSREQLLQKRKSVRYDTSKAATELGWKPVVPLEEGLRKTFEWYGSQKRGREQ